MSSSVNISTIPATPMGTPMNDKVLHLLHNLFSFDITADLLGRDFVQQALIAAALLALVAGLIGPFIVMRQMSFAVHGSSELSLTGAAFALLTGLNVGLGALFGSALAAILFGFLGQRARERDSAIGVVMAFGLGMAVLFIHLYPGRAGTSFALLTGQIVGVGYSGLAMLIVVTVLVVATLAITYRPLLFATADPEVAAARGVPVRALGIVFAALVGIVAAQGVQIVGALLVMSLLITPAAAAARVFSSPVATITASVVFAEISAVGGIVASLAPGVPVSVFVTTISFGIYLVCWAIGRRRLDPAAA
jgi:zinc/manganese transport system permease protein